jgi:hypothetical protein
MSAEMDRESYIFVTCVAADSVCCGCSVGVHQTWTTVAVLELNYRHLSAFVFCEDDDCSILRNLN